MNKAKIWWRKLHALREIIMVDIYTNKNLTLKN